MNCSQIKLELPAREAGQTMMNIFVCVVAVANNSGSSEGQARVSATS